MISQALNNYLIWFRFNDIEFRWSIFFPTLEADACWLCVCVFFRWRENAIKSDINTEKLV